MSASTTRTAATALLCAVAIALPAAGKELRFFRIGTGGTGATYYPVASLIAHAISEPPGSVPCATTKPCGVPGLVVSAIATSGSVANVEAIENGSLESGFVQGDIATWAHGGNGLWQGRSPVDKLRAIASLYPETIHLIASRASGIASVTDLRGKRVSLDEPGSGTLVDAGIILAAAGLTLDDLDEQHLSLSAAASAMQEGRLDAFFFVGGAPAAVISELASEHGVIVVPIDDHTAAAAIGNHAFLHRDQLPAHSYEGQRTAVPTLSISAIWVTSADQPESLIHDITRALFSPRTRAELQSGHDKAREIRPATALQGVGLPLHPGALRYYRESGLLERPHP